jgi:hypothetical protein
MIETISVWVEILFIIIFLITLLFFYLSNGKPIKLVVLICAWALAQSGLALSGFYLDQSSFPRFILVLLPVFLFTGYGLLPQNITWMLNKRDVQLSTFLHSVRLPIEIILFELYLNKMIPQLMTFEGRNFDIVVGITAPIVGYLCLKKRISNTKLIIWNVIGVFFVCFILINGILSSELPFQQFAFEQPNRAVNFFPFILLPAVIVPIVIWTHITDIIKLSRDK